MPLRKTWVDFTPKYRRELCDKVAETFLDKCADADEIAAFMHQVKVRLESKLGKSLPEVANPRGDEVITVDNAQSLLHSLGELRQKHSHNSQLHIAKVTPHDLDRVVCARLSRSVLNTSGYPIGRVQYRHASSPTDVPPSRVGRKSKIHDPEVVQSVGTIRNQYTQDSSKVICIGRGKDKELVCAQILSKKLFHIWKAEPALRKQLGWSTFLAIRRLHFPRIRPPQRKTDVCDHCRTLKRHVAPRAWKEYKKRRLQIEAECPEYFHDLDAAPAFQALVDADKTEDLVLQARQYIQLRNASATTDPLRANLSRTNRLSLFQREARALHKLRGHADLLEAYLWHWRTAERQLNSTQTVLNRLTDAEAYLHFDFKENVRYPMSREETGDEWHAQNKRLGSTCPLSFLPGLPNACVAG